MFMLKNKEKMTWKDKYKIEVFLGILFLQSAAANFAHPITPTLLMKLGVSEYMFGLAFAMMAAALFLFSPFWGKMREFFQTKNLLLTGSLGYGFGQYLFGIAGGESSILAARLVSGFFVGAIGVSVLIYVTEISSKEAVGENLARLAITQALGGSFGYFIGGMIGVYSLPLTFHLQTATLFVCGLLFYSLLEKVEIKKEKIGLGHLLKEVNPLKSFLLCRHFLTGYFTLILFVILTVMLASNAFDQAFNYYLKAGLHFSSVYNGILKAVTGIVTLLVVSTICMWIIRRGRVGRSTAILLFVSFFTVVGIMSLRQVFVVLSLSVLFSSLNAIITPLLQDIMVKEGGEEGRNILMGLYNSVRSLGMIIGALLSGFLYPLGPKVPFFLSAFCLILTGGIMLLLARKIDEK